MSGHGGTEEIDVLASRIDIVELLLGEPRHKADLVSESKYSRSTINRAIRELEEAGYVERVSEGFVATQTGQLGADQYRSYMERQRSILGAADVLEQLPHDVDIPPALVTDSRIETDDASHQLFELLATELHTAEEVRLVLPALLDSRYLRVCHSRVVREELTVTLQAPEAVLRDTAREFPFIWEELADSSSFTALSGGEPPFGLVLALAEGAVRSVAVFTSDGAAVTGVVHAETDAITDWGREQYDALEADSGDISADIRAEVTNTSLSTLTDDRLPAPLRSQGFVRVDDSYFERREPLEPATALRAGLDLPEVAAGYAFERTREAAESNDGDDSDGGRQSLTGEIEKRLLDGEDAALVGPPGSGKSTACKSVACRWYENDNGTVLYRESGRGQPFEAATLLETVLGQAEDHVLVVVEDAPRPEANGIFDVIHNLSGREDVSFLLDARNQEWHDPEEFPVDARLRALRREAIETMTVPPLDEHDCETLRRRTESVTGEQLDVPVEDLLTSIRQSDDTGSEAAPGVLSTLVRRMVRYADPIADTDPATTLDETIDRLRADVAEHGETALDTAVLVNALNAAGLDVSPEYLYALAAEGETEDEIQAALDRLSGTVLFPSREEESTSYRTVHETWSVRFLERLLDVESEAAQGRFGQCLSCFLSLAEDPDRRDAVAGAVDGNATGLEPILKDPGSWADETVATLFALGRSYPKLARLYGTSSESALNLPSVCSPQTRVRTAEWRGQMYAGTDDLDRAGAEFRELGDAAEQLPPTAAGRARAVSLLGRSDVARRRGDTEDAATYAREGHTIVDELEAPLLRARARRRLGRTAEARGEFDQAKEQYLAGLEAERAAGDRYGQAKTHEKIGGATMKQGDLETAKGHLEDGLDLFRELGDRTGEADCLRTIGAVAMKRSDVPAARRRLHQALDIYRETGNRQSQSATLSNLGLTALRAGEVRGAREYFEECLAIDREVGDRHGQAQSLNCLGEAAQRAGDLSAAREYIEECLDSYREIGDRHGEALASGSLGSIARKEGDLEAARSNHRRSLDLKREIGDEHGEAASLDNLGLVARREGDLETTREYHQQALEIQRSVGDSHGEALSLVHLGRVADEAGDRATARERYEQCLDVARAADVDVARARAQRHLGELAREAGDVGAARERFETALSLFESNGYAADELDTRIEIIGMAVDAGHTEIAEEQSAVALGRLDDIDASLAARRERLEILQEAADQAASAGERTRH